MSNFRMLAEEEESDDAAEVTWEDQERINTFSKLNTRLRGIEDRLEALKQEKEALDDLATELELTDEDNIVLYKIGDAFLHLPQPLALSRLEKDNADISAQLGALSATAEECDKGMKALKVVLYAKFGHAINLDE
ncbi:Prefoldin subunit 4 [Boletus edulis]|uniref:Prefoldin subunit 4 n=1 Tax=Boletus edulis BED1 TaxID=1328754 RepID=A0AAD4G7L0_BOLED|nr:Prefoldin subunit 4 [Boletus edulis]KAF8421149.1 Prefoldin subunit-domain-containing protein [Boletus edulis BED1]